MNTKSPECYTTDPQARCLRVEFLPGRLLLLPLSQFAFAEFTANGKEQLLRLSFATHEIIVRGNALRRIETALHRIELSSITPLPAKYHSLIAEGQPRIHEIEVTEMKLGPEQSGLNQASQV